MTPFNSSQIDKSWTLFLDRDGVINEELRNAYVTAWDEFAFCDGALHALKNLTDLFGRLIVVTNQRGVGRGIMTLEELREVNKRMQEDVAAAGGRVDRIYSCIAIDDSDHNRKPNTGMALQAREDYPQIDFHKSVMVGNNLSDMEFGKRMGMYTVFVCTTHAPHDLPHELIDEQYPSLKAWAESLAQIPVLG